MTEEYQRENYIAKQNKSIHSDGIIQKASFLRR